jgi:hypothetical protein
MAVWKRNLCALLLPLQRFDTWTVAISKQQMMPTGFQMDDAKGLSYGWTTTQKEGLKSSAQKETRARDAKTPLPASKPVGGAFGGAES